MPEPAVALATALGNPGLGNLVSQVVEQVSPGPEPQARTVMVPVRRAEERWAVEVQMHLNRQLAVEELESTEGDNSSRKSTPGR